MNYYDDRSAYEARGIDWDLVACLQYNAQDGFTVADIAKVLAVVEGENDGADWRWVLRLNDGRFVFLQGGCDYTGWDCQSSADSAIVDTIAAVLQAARDAGRFEKNDAEIIANLARQIVGAKELTWHEQTGKDFGL